MQIFLMSETLVDVLKDDEDDDDADEDLPLALALAQRIKSPLVQDSLLISTTKGHASKISVILNK